MKKIVIILDGYRSDKFGLISGKFAPGIFRNASILPSFSYEPDASYLCGQYPEETDSGTHYLYDPERSEFREFEKILNMLLERPPPVRKFCKRILLKVMKLKGVDTRKYSNKLGNTHVAAQ